MNDINTFHARGNDDPFFIKTRQDGIALADADTTSVYWHNNELWWLCQTERIRRNEMGYDVYAHEDGFNDGNLAGLKEGLALGRQQGYDKGYRRGHDDGYSKGRDDGWNACLVKAREQIWIGNENIRLFQEQIAVLCAVLKRLAPMMLDEEVARIAEFRINIEKGEIVPMVR